MADIQTTPIPQTPRPRLRQPHQIKVKSTGPDRVFDLINNAALTLMFLAVLYPLVYIVSCSFSSVQAIYSGKVWLWPVGFNTIAYEEIFQYRPVLTGYANTLFYTTFGTAINVVLTVMAAYPLSRRDLVGRNALMFLFTFTMIFNGGLIPTYLVVRNLGMLNTRWAMLIPPAIGVYNVIITRTFFQHTIPDDLLDAARIDGASDIQFIVRVVLPLSGAVIAVITLFYAVFHWNAFFHAFIYLSRRHLYPLQIFLREILVMNEIDPQMIVDPEEMQAMENLRELLKYALIIVATVPILTLYPFVQKYFVRGVMLGSIKG
jgi:multiple sugar transport system permease protein/putative aldouronate transport system permease protein